MIHSRKLLFSFFLPLVILGCGREDVSVYRIPKETAPKDQGDAELPRRMAQETVSEESFEEKDLHWKAPEGWKELQASGMRHASFSVQVPKGNADMSVVVLPGPAGGDLANVNRWRDQIGLGPLDEKALAERSKKLPTPVGTLVLVDFAGPKKEDGADRVLAAILSTGGKTWFFKLAGKEKVVEEAKPSFLGFLKSLHFPEKS